MGLKTVSPLLGTHIDFGHLSQQPLDLPGVIFVLQSGEGGGPVGWLISIVFRKERIEPAGVDKGEGIDHVFDDLQLGSAGIEVGHFECLGSVLEEQQGV